jgi:hypothetical protein
VNKPSLFGRARVGGGAVTSDSAGMYDPPASPRFRYPAPLDEDDDLPTTPGGGESSLFTTTANPLTKPPLAPFRGAWAETPRSPLKRGKAGSDERRGATPTKLAKSPARRRVLSDLYGRLTVATEREPFEGASGETEATGEGETEEVGSQRAAARAPLRVACRPPRRSEDGPKIIQLLTPVSAARLAEDFAGLPSTLSVPW